MNCSADEKKQQCDSAFYKNKKYIQKEIAKYPISILEIWNT